MKKQIIGILVALLVLSVAVYAHETNDEKDSEVTDIDKMNETHEIMTEGLEPVLKQQMNVMHEGCISQFNKDRDDRNSMMGGGMMDWDS
jgi:hypothetical protein